MALSPRTVTVLIAGAAAAVSATATTIVAAVRGRKLRKQLKAAEEAKKQLVGKVEEALSRQKTTDEKLNALEKIVEAMKAPPAEVVKPEPAKA